MMNDIFRDCLDHFVIIYIDDILIYSANQAEHDEHVALVLARLQEHNLFAKLEKMLFRSRLCGISWIYGDPSRNSDGSKEGGYTPLLVSSKVGT